LWMTINTVRHEGPINFHDDPPQFSILEFVISLEAIMLSVFVLYTQRRQKERETIKADLDYQVSRLAHLEIMQLHEKVDRLRGEIRQFSDPVRNSPQPSEGQKHGPDNLVE
jgi:CRP/FNR family transcriptional regulator, cyclic AMP receptor protein